ncbi:hypothetical protein KXV71_000771 [Aspergillus fumigatus]|nr:hypothetical protein KXX41_000921 [Aspergillus fumigatus]KAH2469898.1 hypothetical protein KXV71_000771 [Aspergillus fumigatus]
MAKSQEGFVWSSKDGFRYGLPTAAVVASTPKSELSASYDVIVIGAGFAGLTVARDLGFKGKKVLLIEARDRIGGRCWTVDTGETAKLEMGGTWVHWIQPHVFSELQRCDLDEFVETVAFPENCESVKKASRQDPAVVHDPAEGQAMMEQLEGLMAKFFDIDGQGGRSVIPFPFNMASSTKHNPEYLELDKLSIADRVAQMPDCDEEQRAVLGAQAASFYGIAPEKGAFTEVLHTQALCNFDPAMTEIATMKYKIAEGTTAFALAILNDFKGDRIFSSPVQSISQPSDHAPVAVTLKNGEQFTSNSVVSTIPVNVLSSITFNPPLSPLKKEAFSDAVTPARIDKLLVCTPTKFANGFTVSCEGGDMPFASGFLDGTHGSHNLLTLLTHPDNKFDSAEDDIRLVETLHPSGVEVHSVYGHIWSDDPYAGGVMPVRKPGFLGKYHDEIRKPHGNVHFCGSDFADGWRGFISGAFEDAYRVTREVETSLSIK